MIKHSQTLSNNSSILLMQDNLFTAKVSQAHQANRHRGPEIVGDRVMLSTFHRHQEYRKKEDERAAKFFPRWDGPYTVVEARPQTSNYMLDMAGHYSIYPTYHPSELKRHIANDPELFPNRDHPRPGPVLTCRRFGRT